MNCETLQCRVTIQNPQGLHLRPAVVFAKRAAQFQSTVSVTWGTKRVDGKVPMELLMLAAEQGTEVVIEVSGSDAQAALQVLSEILARTSWDDDSDEDTPIPPKG